MIVNTATWCAIICVASKQVAKNGGIAFYVAHALEVE